MDRICTQCKLSHNGKSAWCRDCKLDYQKKHYIKNREEIRAKQNEYKKKNRQKILDYKKRNRDENKEEIKKYRKQWKEENKEKVKKDRKRYREEYMKNPVNKLANSIRGRIKRAITCEYKSGTWREYLGCSVEDCKKYLENKFEAGMTWKNHGEWHIDHIKPISSFDLSNKDEIKKAFNYTNLQPLWAIDNLRKGNKVD